MHVPDPKFPPLFNGFAVNAPVRSLDEACDGVRAGRYSAGDLVWARATDRMSLALVLEPDVQLATALQMNALAHAAVAETIGHACPPQLNIQSRWPGGILVNGATCGSVVMATPTADLSCVPDWLVLGVDLVISADQRREPGERPDVTSLFEEGADVTRTDLVEALATRLLAWLHTWQTDGFRPVHDQWLTHAEGRDADVDIEGITGRVLGLDETGRLLMKPADGSALRTLPMLSHLRVLE